MRRAITLLALLTLSTTTGQAQSAVTLSPLVRQFVSVDAPVVALAHVRVIDGTGAAPEQDQTVVIENSRIRAVGPASTLQVPAGAKVLDLQGDIQRGGGL